MTFRSRICSSLLAAVAAAHAATVTGRVELKDSRRAEVLRARNFSEVAVWLEPVSGRASSPAAQVHKVLQKGKRFIPHVSVIGVGSTVDWPNLDPIFHNAFSNFAGQPFDTGLYPPGGTQKIRFGREGVVRVFCNIHATMSAIVVVVNSPWFASTKPDGSYSIEGVPPGEYVLKVWHERTEPGALKAAEQRIAVPAAGGVAVSAIALSEAGYAPVAHLNKFGKEYGPEPPARGGYPAKGGAR